MTWQFEAARARHRQFWLAFFCPARGSAAGDGNGRRHLLLPGCHCSGDPSFPLCSSDLDAEDRSTWAAAVLERMLR